MKADIKIILEPVEITLRCPNCESRIEIDYAEFKDIMGTEEIDDWVNKTIMCEECDTEIVISDVD